MRVLTVTNFYPPDAVGGYEVACAQMVAELRGRGHAVRVLTATPPAPVRDDDPEVRRLLRRDETANPLLAPPNWRATATRSFIVDSHNVELLRQEVEAFAPDVVHLWNLTGVAGVSLALAVELRGLPWVWHLGDAVPIWLTALGVAGDRSFARRFTRSLTGTWVANSQGLVDEIAAGGGELQGRVTLMPDWIAQPPAPRRREWWDGGRPLRCLSAGQLAWEKGVHIALEALGLLRDEGRTDVELDIVGDGPERFGLEARVGRLRLEGQVRFHGRLTPARTRDWFDTADVLLFPTAPREPFGWVALGATDHGCVPIVTAGCGVTEWLMDGVHLITATRDAEGFAAALHDVLTGRTDLGGLGRRGQAATRDFHLDRVADRHERDLLDAAASPRPPAVSWEDILRMARIGETIAYRVFVAPA
ncbi:MAG: glycosyltransferase [Candidatus Dormibacteria bacterium]|jgi:glycosyltransferase involved in cell wall biosynthesis